MHKNQPKSIDTFKKVALTNCQMGQSKGGCCGQEPPDPPDPPPNGNSSGSGG